jgi:AraC-like DNA-binding protein
LGGDINLAALRGIPLALKDLGVPAAELLNAVGLKAALFEQHEASCDVIRLGRLMDACIKATGVGHFGLLAGAHFELPMMGLLGHLVRNEATVKAALRTLSEKLQLHDRAGVVSVVELGSSQVGVSYAVNVPGTVAMGAIDDVSLMVGIRILETLCGKQWSPAQVQIAHRAPNRSGVYARFFRAPVIFNAVQSMIVLHKRWLDAAVPGADAGLLALLRQSARELEATSAASLAEQVRTLARVAVMEGQFSAELVARRLGVSERTLRRRLETEGLCLSALLAEVRLITSRQLLEDTSLSIHEIAVALNYSHRSAFSRAFRQWMGAPPSHWRRGP